MGSDTGSDDERPAHTLMLAEFLIDSLPVINRRFAEFHNAVRPLNPRGERLFDVDDPDARIRRNTGQWLADQGYENHPVVEQAQGAITEGHCAVWIDNWCNAP